MSLIIKYKLITLIITQINTNKIHIYTYCGVEIK